MYNHSHANLHNLQNQLNYLTGSQGQAYRDSSLDAILKRHSSHNATIGVHGFKSGIGGSEVDLHEQQQLSTSMLAQDLQQQRLQELPSTKLATYFNQQNTKGEKAHHYRMRSNEVP